MRIDVYMGMLSLGAVQVTRLPVRDDLIQMPGRDNQYRTYRVRDAVHYALEVGSTVSDEHRTIGFVQVEHDRGY